MKRTCLIIILLTIFFYTKAQLKIDAEYRPRFEYRDGYGTLKSENSEPAYFVTQRTRLNFNHTFNNLNSVISIQDYRVWGDSKLKADDPGISVYEAYFKLALNNYWFISAGRQSFDIDNKRLFSSANWNQVGSSHDGLTIDLKKESINFKMLTAFNQTKTANYGTDYTAQISNYKFLNVIWFEKKIENITLANLTITDGYQKLGTKNTDYYRLTTGAIIKYKKAASDLQVRGFYQTGKNQKGLDVSAYYASASYTYKFAPKFELTGGFEYMSGNDLSDTTNKKDNAFDILYGARHAFNGMLDYFHIPSTTKNAGLFDGYVKADISKIQNWKFIIQYHYFSLANNYVYDNKKESKFLAHETDFIASWKMNDIIDLQLGYGLLFGSKTLDHLQGVESIGIQQFFYTMITVKPTFFNNK